MEQTAVEWFSNQISEIMGKISLSQEQEEKLINLLEQAKELESYHAKVEAKKYYLKGFEVAELTESQNVTHEQTMKDAESFFELIYPLKLEI